MKRSKICGSWISTGILLCSLLAPAVPALADEDSPTESRMQEYVDAMRSGWNLGNTYDAIPNETAWGNPTPTQELIQQVAAQGFKSIRIPVTWSPHVGPAPDYAIDPAWLAKIQQVVEWSLQAGLHVMINMHHDSWLWVSAMPTSHAAVLAEYSAIWTQIAAGFARYPRRVMFESINEPSFDNVPDATAMSLLDELNTAFVNIVRSSGGENARRPLVLPPLHTGGGTQSWLDSLSNTVTKLTDLLATMESVYAGGGNAGPASWTSYQQFGSAFTPDYANNTLTLPAAFFAGGNGGTIDLTLHFWSGQIVKYQLVVSGTGVTGSPL